MLLLIVIACGCDTPKGADLDEQKNPHFIEGKERTKARDIKGAIEAFQRALDANPNSALAHFELGMLYEKHDEQNEWRYVLALYHYYRAYELRPNAYPADNAKLRMQACRQELAKAESLAPLYPAMQRELEKLREENSQIRRQLEFLQNQALARSGSTATNQPDRDRAPVAFRTTSDRPLASPTFGSAAATHTISDRAPASLTFGSRVAAHPTELTDNSRLPRPLGSSEIPAAPAGVASVASGSGRKHTVKERETFASIARTYRLPIQSVLAANPGVEPKRLRAGQTVNIPSS